ncbi:CsgG/HfaB family protein [Isoalcanivorax beigongshangi]|uniref:CsgG/HfaB family protein n=1 Tax=Isoalcanivorax beigongshangi TaxID=3238810 RepID=A0ABV4AFP0_9GAMM
MGSKTPFIRLLVLVSLLVAAPFSLAAGLHVVTVEGTGEGQNLAQATASALVSALAQVNGVHVEAVQFMAEVTVALETSSSSDFASATANAEAISQATGGAVKAYRIVSQENMGGHWRVQVEAQVAAYQRSVQSDRLRIVVLPFRPAQRGVDKSIEGALASELNTYLTQSRRFAVLDRTFENERQSEMQIASSASAPIEEMARLGQRLGTDLMLVGHIDQAQVMTQRTELAGRTLTNQTSRVRLQYRIVETATGQVKLAESLTRSQEGADLQRLVQRIAEDMARDIVDAIFPITVESISGESLFLGQGGRLLKAGQVYRLIQRGEVIHDSYTGESLGHQELNVGRVRITDVQSKLAQAQVLELSGDLRDLFGPGRLILRGPLAEPPASPTRESNNRPPPSAATPASSGISTMQKTLESDW